MIHTNPYNCVSCLLPVHLVYDLNWGDNAFYIHHCYDLMLNAGWDLQCSCLRQEALWWYTINWRLLASIYESLHNKQRVEHEQFIIILESIGTCIYITARLAQVSTNYWLSNDKSMFVVCCFHHIICHTILRQDIIGELIHRVMLGGIIYRKGVSVAC